MSLRKFVTTTMRPVAQTRNRINPGARILMYHRVNDFDSIDYPDGFDQLRVKTRTFDDQMRWLRDNRQVVSTGELLSSLESNDNLSNLVAVTFDDGYLDNLEYALPILSKYSIPATIYVTSHFAEQTASHYRYPNESGRLHLDWNEIAKLNDNPLITIGSHTVTHPMLSELTQDEALREISDSKAHIEKHTGVSVDEFCYPSGNYTWREEQMAKNSHYRAAVTVKPGLNRHGKSLYTLRRTEVTDKDDLQAFAAKMDGALDFIHRLLDFRREVIFSRNRKNAEQ